jgi:XRE family transcriptional regulator, aerobic/anaerobic benzoate catabolism transcriptional regulator
MSMDASALSSPGMTTPPVETNLLRELGDRVRQTRTRRGITRRVLAAQSTVSERYLAQLEAGEGNASILVLQRIATALGLALAELVADSPTPALEYVLLQTLLKDLPSATLNRIRLQLLKDYGAELGDSRAADAPRIALLGLRGAGKSTLGARLAAHCGVPFIELDREIEHRSGTPLEEIFLLYGQAAYRRHELRCLTQVLAENSACVIATGGSIVSEPAAYTLLLSACTTVWLKATPAEHMARVIAQGDLRPMAGNAEAMADLQRILDERTPLYAQAERIVDTSGLSAPEAFQSLVRVLEVKSTLENTR